MLHTLKIGQYVLTQVIGRARAAEEREMRFKDSEKDAEKARVGKAMLGFEEDRRLKKEKDDRGEALVFFLSRDILLLSDILYSTPLVLRQNRSRF